jgi:lipoyl(octanoyl) transferase
MQDRGVSFFHTNRGGDITFHGPGQVVGYLIFDLEKLHLGLKAFIFKLEEAIIQLLEHYGLQGARLSGATGVWLDAETPNARKICAIGLRSSHFVTMHGFALNVNTDLNYFNYIHPCGFVDKGVTSLQKELGQTVNEDEVKNLLTIQIKKEFL